MPIPALHGNDPRTGLAGALGPQTRRRAVSGATQGQDTTAGTFVPGLPQNVTVPGSVEALAEDGNITLTGTVSYGTERAAAEAAVYGLAGVRNVSNEIDISYLIDPVDVDLHVQQALDRSALVPDGSDVTADTKDGIITLTGHVRTWAEHDAVLAAALMARGSSTSATTSRSPADRRQRGPGTHAPERAPGSGRLKRGEYGDEVLTSLIVLKALSDRVNGTIVAVPHELPARGSRRRAQLGTTAAPGCAARCLR